MTPAWSTGHALLTTRLATMAQALRATGDLATAPLDVALAPGMRVIATGIGSSEAHARFLAHWLSECGGIDARVVPLTACATAAADVLVVFSQGLSPNAQLALESGPARHATILVSAVTDPARLDPLRARGVRLRTMAGNDEFRTLVRVIGPRCGYVAATLLARDLMRASGRPHDIPALAIDTIIGASEAAAARVATIDVAAFDRPTAFVACGSYGALACNLSYKVLEGFLRPPPPVWDVLHIAHGPFQQMTSAAATFVALTHDDDPREADLFARLARMLDPTRHTIMPLGATLPGPLAIFEHEAALDALMLRWISRQRLDQIAFPGRGMDGPLYDVRTARPPKTLAATTWPALDVQHSTTAVLPLGACEQHGPHLPFATDTWIAEALAARLCARRPEAIALPALPFGHSVEHLAFPGTIDLGPDTLVAVLHDVLRSLARHGFARVFVFSAHGGNVATLAAALPTLRAAVPGMEVSAHVDLAGLTRALHDTAERLGVTGPAGGHHAGEIETSMMLAVRPATVELSAAAAGWTAPIDDSQTLFYPSLRDRVPSGTIGDPRHPSALRGGRYLDVWTNVLVATFDAAKNRHHTKGTHQA